MTLPSPPDAIPLPPNCTTVEAPPLHALMLAAAGEGPVRVDGTSVENLGQAVLQLLLGAARGPGLAWAGASDALTARAGSLGLSAALGLGPMGLGE